MKDRTILNIKGTVGLMLGKGALGTVMVPCAAPLWCSGNLSDVFCGWGPGVMPANPLVFTLPRVAQGYQGLHRVTTSFVGPTSKKCVKDCCYRCHHFQSYSYSLTKIISTSNVNEQIKDSMQKWCT